MQMRGEASSLLCRREVELDCGGRDDLRGGMRRVFASENSLDQIRPMEARGELVEGVVLSEAGEEIIDVAPALDCAVVETVVGIDHQFAVDRDTGEHAFLIRHGI